MNIPIKIQIEDNKKFGDVCFLLDSDDFSNQAEKIRQKVGLKERFHGSISEWKARDTNGGRDNKLARLFNNLDSKDKDSVTKEIEKIAPTDIELEQVVTDNISLMGLPIEIEKLHDLFAFPDLLNEAVFASMVCDTVTDDDYVLAKLDFFDGFSNPEAPKNKRRPFFAIEITPWTRMVDIEEAFKLKDNFKLDYSAFYGQFDFHLNKDSLSNVKRDRKWYWMNKNGESYLDIAKTEAYKYKLDAEELRGGIAKAVGQYKKRLIKPHNRIV